MKGYTALLAEWVDRDLAPNERLVIGVQVMAARLTLNMAVLGGLGAALGTLIASSGGLPPWIGGGLGGAMGAVLGLYVAGARQSQAVGDLPLSPSMALGLTNRRLLLYRRTLANRPTELLVALPIGQITAISVEAGTFLRPRPITIGLTGGVILELEGARSDPVEELPERLREIRQA